MRTASHLLRQVAWIALAVCAAFCLLLLSMTLGQQFGPLERLTLLMVTALLGWSAFRVRPKATRRR